MRVKFTVEVSSDDGKVAKSAKTVEGAFLENRRTERNSSLRKTSRKSAHNQRTSGGHAAEIGTRRNKQ